MMDLLAQLRSELQSQQSLNPHFNGSDFGGGPYLLNDARTIPSYADDWSADPSAIATALLRPGSGLLSDDFHSAGLPQSSMGLDQNHRLLQVLQQQAALQQEQQQLEAIIELNQLQMYLSLTGNSAASNNNSNHHLSTESLNPTAWQHSRASGAAGGGSAFDGLLPFAEDGTGGQPDLHMMMQYLSVEEQHRLLAGNVSPPPNVPLRGAPMQQQQQLHQQHQQRMSQVDNRSRAFQSEMAGASSNGPQRQQGPPPFIKQRGPPARQQSLPARHQQWQPALQSSASNQQLHQGNGNSNHNLSSNGGGSNNNLSNNGGGSNGALGAGGYRKKATHHPVSRAPSWAGADWHPRNSVVAGAGTGVFLPDAPAATAATASPMAKARAAASSLSPESLCKSGGSSSSGPSSTQSLTLPPASSCASSWHNGGGGNSSILSSLSSITADSTCSQSLLSSDCIDVYGFVL